MQHSRTRTLFEHLSRSLLLASAGALLVTGLGLGLFAQRNIGLTVGLVETLRGVQAIAADPVPVPRDETLLRLQQLLDNPLRDPLHVQLLDAEGAVLFDSLVQHTALMASVRILSPAQTDLRMRYPLAAHPALTLSVGSNPLSEVREAFENLSVALGALLALTALLYRAIRQRMRKAFAPLGPITERLHQLEKGVSDETLLPLADTAELNRIAQSVNHLQRELAQLHSRQQEWMNRLEDLQERERRQIAAELHDELGQHLTALQVDAATLKRMSAGHTGALAVAQAIADNSQTLMQRVRGLLVRLQPSGLDGAEDQTSALHDSLNRMIREWQERLPATHFDLSLELPEFNLPSRVSLAAYRLVQEGLTNAARHADAGCIRVAIGCTPARDGGCLLDIRIEDDGNGLHQTPRSLLERTRNNGGHLAISNRPEGGCIIHITLPIYDDEAMRSAAGTLSRLTQPHAQTAQVHTGPQKT